MDSRGKLRIPAILPNHDTRFETSLTFYAKPQQALGHIWLSGKNATDHDLLPELRKAREARAKLKHAILAVSLRKRIAALQDVESDSDSDEMAAAEEAIPGQPAASSKTNVLREKVKDGSLFRSVALAAIKDHAAKKEAEITDEDLVKQANRKSFNSES